MAVSFTANPAETFTVSNQRLVYTCSESGTLGAGYRFVVTVFEYDNTTATEIAKLYLTPNSNNKAHIDINKIVKERVKVDTLEDSGAGVIHSEQQVTTSTNASRKFRVDGAAYTTSGGEDDADVSKYIYLIDGAFQILDGLNPSFADYYPTTNTNPRKKTWLTDRWDDNKNIDNSDTIEYYMQDSDEAVVAWIHDSNIITGLDTKLTSSLYNASGLVGTSTFDITAIGGDALTVTNYNKKVHYVGIGPSNFQWATETPTTDTDWTYYTIRLDVGRSQCSKYIKVIKDCNTERGQRVQLAYTNRLGGWDYLAFEGITEKTENKTDKPYLKQIGDWDSTTYTSNTFDREMQSAQVEVTKSYTLKTNRFTVEDFYCLQGALRSDNVMIKFNYQKKYNSDYTEDGKGWMPVNIKDSSYRIRDISNAKVYDVSCKVELAQQIKC